MGELTSVWLPDAEQEAIRDLLSTRDDFKVLQSRVRQQLLAFLLRHSQRWITDTKGVGQNRYCTYTDDQNNFDKFILEYNYFNL